MTTQELFENITKIIAAPHSHILQGWETFINTFTKEVFDWNETGDGV